MTTSIISEASPKINNIGSILYDPHTRAMIIASEPMGRGVRANITLPELVAIHQTCKGEKKPTVCTIVKHSGEFDGFTLWFCGFEIDIYDDLEDLETAIAELRKG